MALSDPSRRVHDYDLIEAFFEECLATGRGTEAFDFAESWGYRDSACAAFIARQQQKAIDRFQRCCNDGISEGYELSVVQRVGFYRNQYLSPQSDQSEEAVHIWDITEDADVLDQRAVKDAMRKVEEAAPGDALEVAQQALGQLIAERS